MPQSLTLVDPSVGALFTIPASAWSAINGEVRTILIQMAMEPGSPLEGTPLGNACSSWGMQILPGLHQLSGSLSQFSGTAVQLLTELETIVAGLAPNEPLTPEMKAKALGVFQPLASGSQALRQPSDELMTQISAFVNVIKADDADVREDMIARGQDPGTMFASMAAVEQACGQVLGGWQAISDDLDSIASQQVSLTIAILLSLDIQSAVLAWTNLGAEARAYGSTEPAYLF